MLPCSFLCVCMRVCSMCSCDEQMTLSKTQTKRSKMNQSNQPVMVRKKSHQSSPDQSGPRGQSEGEVNKLPAGVWLPLHFSYCIRWSEKSFGCVLLLLYLRSFVPVLPFSCCSCLIVSHCVSCSYSRNVPAAHGGGELRTIHPALVLQQSGSGVQALHLDWLWRQQQPLPPAGGVWRCLPRQSWRYCTKHTGHSHILNVN